MLLFVKCIGSRLNTTLAIDIEDTNRCNVQEFKRIIRLKVPGVNIKRLLFAGKQLNEDDAKLSSFAVYKECMIQLIGARSLENQDIEESKQSAPRKRTESTVVPAFHGLNRQKTLGCIQFGDALLVELLGAKNLVGSKKKIDTYCRVVFGGHEVKSAVAKKSLNPEWNETFGFYLNLKKGKFPEKLVVHLHERGVIDRRLGKVEVAFKDITRLPASFRAFPMKKSKGDQVVMSVRRVPLTSQRLAEIVQKASQKAASSVKPFSESLRKYDETVQIEHIAGTRPLRVLGEGKRNVNPALTYLKSLVQKGDLKLENKHTTARILHILQTQGAILTNDPISRTLCVSDLASSEAALFGTQGKIFPTQMKAVVYVHAQPVEDQPRVPAHCLVVFKNETFALNALLFLYLQHYSKFRLGFGSDPDFDGDRLVLPPAVRSGILAVNTLEFRARRKHANAVVVEEIIDDGKEAENGKPSPADEATWPYFWVTVRTDAGGNGCSHVVSGYKRMQDTEPDFELDLADFLVLKSGSQSFEFVHRETREVYYMRAPSQKCLDSWHQVLRPSRQQEEAGQAIAEQPSGEKGVSASEPVIMRCPSCKNDRPLSHMYAPDAQP
eukprot:509742_1